jgi:hypothetical protein
MKMKEKIKRTRAPGAGRKRIEDKVRMIPLYIRDSRIAELGGEKAIRDRCMEILDVPGKITEDRVD